VSPVAVTDPTTGRTAFEIEPTGEREAAAALDRAREAQRGWAGLGALGRAARLNAAADRIAADAELAGLIVSDVGKPIAEARAEVARAAAILRYAASLATQPAGEVYEDATGAHVRVVRVPRGVALLITPWNFPVAIPTWKLAPALQAGNAVVLKPATQACRIAQRLVEHLDLGEVVQLVPGGAATANALLDAGADAVSFTGSTGVGRSIAERLAGRFIPLQLEMGGKNGVYVSGAADPALAARVVLTGAMGYAGQKCTATSLVFVDERAASAVTEELVRQTAALGVGDPHEDATVVGPLIAVDKRDEVAAAIAAARGRGVEVLHGGGPLDGPGAFLAPTLLAGAAPDDAVNREELFAPVLSLQSVAGVDEALARLDALEYGLVAGIVSPLRDEVEHFARHADAGIVRVNAPTAGVEPHVPFGGVKSSSFGPREQGRAGLEFFSETRTIYG
jgi:aldehyde dehydrogenase (NAD+)